jgi:hypothetical protein
MRVVEHNVERTASVDVAQLFDVVVAEDVLPHVLHRWGPIPGVRGTRALTGPWDTPGSRRTVVLGDGHTAREQVLEWRRPARFRYQVDHVSGPFGKLFEYAVGTWDFSTAPPGSRLRWTYAFHAPSPVAAALLSAVVPLAWARYMAQCADLCVARAQALVRGSSLSGR